MKTRTLLGVTFSAVLSAFVGCPMVTGYVADEPIDVARGAP